MYKIFGESIYKIFAKAGLSEGRMISGSKTGPVGHRCVWNGNVITKSHGKVWFGDLNLTKEANTLIEIAKQIGETVYVLREHDCRFGKEYDAIEELINRAVWNSDTGYSNNRW